MTDTGITQRDIDRSQAAASKSAADAQMAELIAAHQSTPEARLARHQAELGRLTSGPNASRSGGDIAALEHQIKTAEAELSMAHEIATAAEQVDAAMVGKSVTGLDPNLASAIADDLHLGINPAMVRAFHVFGKSTDRLGHVVGEFWLDWFEKNPEAQQKFANGDGEMRRRFRLAHMYILGRHDGTTPEEENAYRATLKFPK